MTRTEPLDLDAMEAQARALQDRLRAPQPIRLGESIHRGIDRMLAGAGTLCLNVFALTAEVRRLREAEPEWVYGWLHPGDPIGNTVPCLTEEEARECARIVKGSVMRTRPFGWEWADRHQRVAELANQQTWPDAPLVSVTRKDPE